MELEYQEYKARKIINVHKHVDGGWFWDKYSAHPYVGCRSGCNFCYLRGNYYGSKNPNSFNTHIKVKVNAGELLKKELSYLQRDMIACGDWQQPAENKYRISRQMLEVVHDYQFPVHIIERSPLITRDLDVLTSIKQKTWAGVTFSLSNLDHRLKRAFEPYSPAVKRRLESMHILALGGIYVGAALMPVIPIVGDDLIHLEEAIRAVKDHGGSYILAGGLSMDGFQAQKTLDAFISLDPALEEKVRQFYRWDNAASPSYSPSKQYNRKIGLLVRELCAKHNLLDRIPRYIPDNQFCANKRIAERLFLKTYDLELNGASDYQIWAYRKAAWTVDETPIHIDQCYSSQDLAGLESLPGVGKNIAMEIATWLTEENQTQT